ncbi:MAG: MupA/Atu3671 family FMN-dependent luciferase-like monooxygenase [Actinocatenispora sp.]
MKFGVFYFADGGDVTRPGVYDLLLAGARFADENGFTAVWTPERHFHTFGGIYPNPSVVSAALVGITSRVQIRAGSVVAPLHDPLRIVEDWSVIDNLSHGRVGLSFASGWNAGDFVLAPGSYRERYEVLADTVSTVRSLWRGGTVTRTDGNGDTREVRVFPQPVQPELPVWITSAGSTATFEYAGSVGAGVLTHLLGQDTEELAGKIAAYRKARAASGATGPGNVTLMLHTFLGTDRDQVRAIVRGPMLDYLRSSFNLVSKADLDALPDDEDTAAMIDELVEAAFERYFSEGGLFGTVEDGVATVARLRDLGVDEIGCLIDFGPADSLVLDSLQHLRQLKDRCDAQFGD